MFTIMAFIQLTCLLVRQFALPLPFVLSICLTASEETRGQEFHSRFRTACYLPAEV